ncbi:MAG: DUF6580 family putative transport protein [bacterium]
MNKMKYILNSLASNKIDILIVLTFILIGIFTRTVLHIIPNLEFVTALSITAGVIVKNKKLAFIVPLFTMLFTDLLIGNTIIFIFTWSGFIVPVLIGVLLKKADKSLSYVKLGVLGSLGGLISTLIFFLWTNFGVVLTTSMYSKDLSGLIASYINAIPFVRPQLIGNLILVPLVLLSAKFLFSENRLVVNSKLIHMIEKF